ncbi:HDOD domain-containing protein [Undibacterium sp.]|uniref:HDOD domain-containing protein n=1 Tax=Undibacterium sp. TaxID=1914977 RepID=UPI002C9179B3|nr:HDOD domain-containing protein [Undibacterium sp.]HTD02315.1 HDOD domain-containing protein [Undibacterium sp.]
MPQTLLKLMEQCQSEEVGVAELSRLIAQDTAMTAKMLAVANSSAYHRNGPSNGLDPALQAIGTEMIKTIVINESVSQIFDKLSQPGSTDLRGFWSHSVQSGVTAKVIALKTGYSNPEEAYLAGLLHDVGRLALFAILPKEYAFNFFAADDDSLCAVEERTLQTTHAEVGSWLIEQWSLDSFIADSVLYHHEAPARLEKAHPLIRITYLAHALNSKSLSDAQLEKAGALCALTMADLNEIRGRVTDQVKKSAEQLDIDLDEEVQAPAVPAVAVAKDATKDKMIEQVRGMVLASELGRSFSRQQGESGLLETVAKSARILFHFDGAVILLTNATGDALVGSRVGEHRLRLADFALPLDADGSVIAEAVRERRVMFTAAGQTDMGDGLGVFEEQLLRLFNTDQLACLPLHADGDSLGVIIAGFMSWQGDDLGKRESFLKAFSSQAAMALKALLSEKREADNMTENMSHSYREASRKVAHEVNNPLSIIKNYLGILDRKLLNREVVSGEVTILNEEIDRVGKIIDEFVDVNPAGHAGRTEVSRVVGEVVRLFQQAEFASPLVRIENRMLDESFEIDGSADTLKQIFMNLIKNALEAMSAGGVIEIGSQGQVNRDGVLYVEMWVKDSGPGIAPEVMAKLFSPVKSSKGKGHRGLGLNIVHGLVKKLQGLISCRSTKQGTTFEILLPVAQRTEQESVAYS